MSAATATIIAGASVAASTATAARQASAAKNAAKTQAKAADQALASQAQGYQQQRRDFMPYQQAGTGAVGNLRQMAGQYTGQGQVPLSAPPPTMGDPQGPPPGGNLSSLGTPPPQSGLGQIRGMVGQAAGIPPSAPTPGQAPPMAPQGLLRVKAPTGEIAMMNQEQAQAAVQKGAQVLG